MRNLIQYGAVLRPPTLGAQVRRVRRAFTLLELLLTIAIIAILAALLLPALQNAKGKAHRTRCASHLRQIGAAFIMWAHDHGDKFPMDVSTNSNGTLEFTRTGDALYAFRHFQAISNELMEPKLLVCSADRRIPASNFGLLHNSNISYAINVRAVLGNSDSILVTDRNIRTSARMEYTYLQFGNGDAVEWSSALHGFRGNVLFGDGHVDVVNSQGAAKALTAGGDVLLVIPRGDVAPPESVQPLPEPAIDRLPPGLVDFGNAGGQPAAEGGPKAEPAAPAQPGGGKLPTASRTHGATGGGIGHGNQSQSKPSATEFAVVVPVLGSIEEPQPIPSQTAAPSTEPSTIIAAQPAQPEKPANARPQAVDPDEVTPSGSASLVARIAQHQNWLLILLFILAAILLVASASRRPARRKPV